jgi:hypothetical protein
VGEHVGGGVSPGHELAVVPDEAVTVGHGHGGSPAFLSGKRDFIGFAPPAKMSR